MAEAMTLTQLSDRRADATARLEALKRERGVSTLDGMPFPSDEIDSIQSELDALVEAESEAVRREREAARKAVEAGRAEMRKKIAASEKKRLQALERAEKAASELTDALADALQHGDDIYNGIRALGFRATGDLMREGQAERLSWRLAYAMKPIIGLGSRFGQITFPEQQERFSAPWRKAEETLAEPEIHKAQQ